MSFSAAIDVAIGLVLVFFLFSVAASKINEGVAARLQWRADGLEKGLRRILEGGTEAVGAAAGSRLTAASVTNHELVKNESSPGRKPPYIRPRAFALTVLDVLAPPVHVLVDELRDAAKGDAAVLAILDAPGDDTARVANLDAAVRPPAGAAPTVTLSPDVAATLIPLLDEAKAHIDADPHNPMEQIGKAIANLPDNHPAKRPLTRFYRDAGNDRDKLIRELEGWYDGVMGRMSGWYKRKVGWALLAYSIALVVVFNVDAVAIASRLYRDSATRQAVAAQASRGAEPNSVGDAVSTARSLSIPLGWVNHPHSAKATAVYDSRYWPLRWKDVVPKLFGLFITIGALAFGAKFWFDVLGKISNVRNNGDKPETRQPPTGSATA